jgi:DNA mismatch endonuclease, patch repair protein
MRKSNNKLKRKEYVRDGRAPIPKKEKTSEIMSAIKGKNTKPEIMLRKSLFENNIRGYRIHWKKAPGNPDICFPGRKIAIFVHGCFWHRCPHCNLHIPKSHSEYWTNKFNKNIERDIRHQNELKQLGWRFLIFWECQIKKNLSDCVCKIKKTIC